MTHILTPEQAAKYTWMTPADQKALTLPATEKQVNYIADLLMKGHRASSAHSLPSEGVIPTRDELRTYSRRMASAAIKDLESGPVSHYGLDSIRRILSA